MKTLLQYFEEISQIPRPSGHEEAIADYLVAFAKEHGLECRRDALHNVVIKKPASPGYEKVGAVMLQGHTDMVPAVAEGKEFDFLRQPIELKRDGDIITANGTTLGADDAIAMVMMMHVLADPDAKHPALECVFTTQEETGLYGVQSLDTGDLRAKYMVNIDCGPEGTFVVSCAGGLRVGFTSAMQAEPVEGKVWEFHISGLKSGHSGADIHEERAGALMLAGLLLDRLREKGARLVSVASGDRDNVIPASAKVLFAMQENPADIVAAFTDEAKATYAIADPDIAIELCPASAEKMLTAGDSARAIDLLLLLRHGMVGLSAAMPGMVETSINLASAKINADSLEVHVSLRSSSDARKDWLFRQVQRLGELLGMQVEPSGLYPGWIYEKESPLRDRAVAVYEKLRGEKPKVMGVHGGLECGLLKGKMPELDIIAMGSDSDNHHTVNEWMSVSSLERTYDFVRELLVSLDQ